MCVCVYVYVCVCVCVHFACMYVVLCRYLTTIWEAGPTFLKSDIDMVPCKLLCTLKRDDIYLQICLKYLSADFFSKTADRGEFLKC